MADREGLTTLHFIALRLCGVRFAEGVIFSLALDGQSNPLLCKGIASPLKRHHPNPGIPGWGDGGQRGIDYASFHCAPSLRGALRGRSDFLASA